MPEYIDRKRVLSEIRSLRNRLVLSAQAAEKLESVVNSLSALPVIETAGWLPVCKKPQEDGYYLVWTRNAGMEKCRWSERHQRWMGGAWTQHITHWMRAPPPP